MGIPAMDLRCPVDGHVLARREIERRPIASCRHCHGLWVSGAAIAETRLPSDQIPLESRRAGPQSPDARPRYCPQCAHLMRSEMHSGITIERCPACYSSWLDAGEFDAVRAALLPNAQQPASVRAQASGDWTAWDALGEGVLHLLGAFLDG